MPMSSHYAYLIAALALALALSACEPEQPSVFDPNDIGQTDNGGSHGQGDDNGDDNDDDDTDGGNDPFNSGLLPKTNTLGMVMRGIKAGQFKASTGYWHHISADFYISTNEVTNSLFCQFLNWFSVGPDGLMLDKSLIQGEPQLGGMRMVYDSQKWSQCGWGMYYDEDLGRWRYATGYGEYPAVCVTWYGAKAFCLWAGGDLPTEQQWEYACQGTEFNPANTWYQDNSGHSTHKVGTKMAGQHGLRDMLGNAAEWCRDWYGPTYNGAERTDYSGPEKGIYKVVRGGSCFSGHAGCASDYREFKMAEDCAVDCGFRLMMYM